MAETAFTGSSLTERARLRLEQLISTDIAEAVAAERERCAKIVAAELSEWNSGGEYYANLTLACNTIAAKIRSGE